MRIRIIGAVIAVVLAAIGAVSLVLYVRDADVRAANGAQLVSVYVVKADNTVELRGIVTGRATGNQWIVQQGLKAGEKVVVEGFQKLRPGAAVNAQPWKPVTGPAPADKSPDSGAKTQ